jgi:hypothetical protein
MSSLAERSGLKELSSHQQNCHPERSAAESKDLRFAGASNSVNYWEDAGER